MTIIEEVEKVLAERNEEISGIEAGRAESLAAFDAELKNKEANLKRKRRNDRKFLLPYRRI